MSKLTLVTGASLVFAVGLFISDAWAQYYLGAQAGWTGLPYQTDTIEGLGSVPVGFSAGYNVGARGGYQRGPWRFEEEYSFRQNHTSEFGEDDSTNGVSGNRHTHSIMTNVLYDLTTGWAIRPHIGVGIGAMDVFDGLKVAGRGRSSTTVTGNSVIRRSPACAMTSTPFSPSISTTAIWRRPNRHSAFPTRRFTTARAPTQTTL